MDTHCIKKYALAFVSIVIFSLNLSASDLFEDVIFHVDADVQNATEPRLRCADVTPTNFNLQLGLNGEAVITSTNFGAASNPNCNYEFSKTSNGTPSPTLTYSMSGNHDAFFYILGPTANATSVGACPFDFSILPARIRDVIKVKHRY